jgi:hypothetical protein
MSKTPEGKVKHQVKQLLDAAGAWHNWPVPGGYGIPMLDCVGCIDGFFFAIETKAPGQHLTPRQEFTKAQMEAAGAKVFIIGEKVIERDPDTWYSGMQELEEWLKERHTAIVGYG